MKSKEEDGLLARHFYFVVWRRNELPYSAVDWRTLGSFSNQSSLVMLNLTNPSNEDFDEEPIRVVGLRSHVSVFFCYAE